MLGVIMRMGWMGLAALSVICFGAAGFILQSGLRHEADKAAALKMALPAAVALEAFDATRDVHLAQEVHVLGQVNPEYNYTLTEHHTRKGPDYDVVRRMFVLFGTTDAADATVVRAVMLLREDEVEAFQAYAAEHAKGFTDSGFSFAINGAADTLPDLHDMADDALAKEGLTKAANFVFIQPWLKGRDAALAPDAIVPWGAAGVPGVPGLIFGLMALWRKRRGNPVVVPAQAAPVAAPVAAEPKAVRKGSFVGKVVLGYAAIFAGIALDVKFAMVLLPLFTMLVIGWGAKKAMAAGAREVMALGGGLKAAVSRGTVTPAEMFTPQPAMSKPTSVLPPAIRPGFSFKDLIPKRAVQLEDDDAYTRLAASIRSEQSRRQGA